MEKNDSFLKEEARKKVAEVKRVLLVGSGKGGVGKSLVASALALTLSRRGFRTAILDLDIHGASVPRYLGLEPPVQSVGGGLEPKQVEGLMAMSIGFFTEGRPVPMRGEGKEDLIVDLVAMTNWGSLDCLVVDLPPTAGDELLTAFSVFSGKSRLILVSTPSPYALSVVSLLSKLARQERVQTECGVLNMSYILARGRKTYPFGRPRPRLARKMLEVDALTEIPFEPRLSTEGLRTLLSEEGPFRRAFQRLAVSVSRS
jgi:ATP-binding protein involved in chromosome partitioning